MLIGHFADVHFRGLSRHEEYRRAFSKTFEQLKNELRPDHIVVCGDIVHNKTQGISPELIDQLTWWFRGLADVCPLHVTLGNHDGSCNNLHRQDAISPIINAISHPNIHLYKASGVYQFSPGFNWCVFSVFDEQGWENVRPVKGDVNIALFHGSVAGSVTDAGWALEADMSVGFFEPYDCVMLGDIHKHQVLGRRDGKPWIAYPGSSLQQSYGEEPGKGFLLWDIKGRDDIGMAFHHIEHDRQFWTVDWQGSVTNTLEKARAVLPTGARVRVRSNSLISQPELKQLTNELTTTGASEVVFKDEYVVDASKISAQDMSFERDDIRDVDVLMRLFHGFFSRIELTESEWDQMRCLAQTYVKRVSSDDITARNVRWSLRELSFDNTFGYGENNKIDFRNMVGITGIFGPNRVGKSSIIGTLLYTMFNGTDRGSIKNLHIINSRKDHCRSKLVLNVNDVDYCIERQSVRYETIRGLQHAVTSLNLQTLDDKGAVVRDLNGEQRVDTEKVIRALVGSVEDCLLTGIAVQGDMNRFIDSGSSYRDQVISRFLDLVVFEKMHGYAKEDAAVIKAEMRRVPEREWESMISSKETELQRAAAEMKRSEATLRSKRAQLDELRLELRMTDDSDVITPSDVVRQRKRVDEQRERLQELQCRLKAESLSYDAESSRLLQLSVEKEAIPIDKLEDQLVSLNGLRNNLVDMKHQHEREMIVLQQQESSTLKLLDVPCGDSFPSCKYIKDAHQDRLRIDDQRQAVFGLVKSLDEAQASFDVLLSEGIEEKIRRHTEITRQEHVIQMRVNSTDHTIIVLGREIDEGEDGLTEAEMVLADYMARVVEDEQDAANDMKELICALEQQVDELDKRRVLQATRVGSLTTEVATLRVEQEQHKEVASRWRVLELFLSAVSKKGIPAQVIEAQLPVINSEIARILHGVVDYTLMIEKDPESNVTDVYIDYGDSKRLIELGSGMEKMISSLAIRVALQNASSLPRPEFIMIDEGFGALDETNIDACNRLLVSLKRWFKSIFVVSHVDAVKDIADNFIEITHEGKDSRVVYA